MTSDRPTCFGRMFPDFDRMRPNVREAGKAYSAHYTSLGMGVQSRQVSIDQEQWDACQQCPCFRSCFDQCSGRVLCTLALNDATR